MTRRSGKGGNNHVAEWYGHRVYPEVAATASALDDQRSERCPFISGVTGSQQRCVKSENSQGVCTISSSSNGSRQDWLVCPFRALDLDMIEAAIRKMYGYTDDVDVYIAAATTLSDKSQQTAILSALKSGRPAVAYFQNKLGGEISIGATEKSPEFSFDATTIELGLSSENLLTIGRYGVIEIQTMDFHGSYAAATKNLRDALRLHSDDFANAVQAHPQWMSERVEGPNIANVFKRTFYQMMFKFQIGAHPSSAGCVLAIPRSVWDSWQRHLGAPELVARDDGTWQLGSDDPTLPETGRPPAWIYVFDTQQSTETSPNNLLVWRVIATNAASMSHFALDVAPGAALAEGGSVDRLTVTIRGRLLPLLGSLLAPPTL